jgi:hypothetical protein
MPYAHKTSQPTKNALRRGDLVFAVGGQNLGPTSATGYYNTISPPVNGYAIYSLGLNNNPIGMAVTTDDEIIRAANTLGGSVSSKSDALFYLANRSSTWILQNMPNNIVTDGLVLALNAGLVSSYPRSGTDWYDLSGNGNDWVIASDIYNSDIMEYRSDRSTLSGTTQALMSTTDQTIEIVYKPNTGGIYTGCCDTIFGRYNFRFFQIGTSLYTMIGFDNGSGGRYYTHPAFTVAYDKWHHIVGARRDNRFIIWIDGVEKYNTTYGSGDNLYTTGNNTYNLSATRHTSVDFSSCRVYTKGLSDSEILQNYYQAPIVTDGLVFAVDAGNLVSYENGDTTTYSLTGSNSGTLTNGVGFDSANGGGWVFDGVDDEIDFGNPSELSNAQVTVTFWYNPTTLMNNTHNGIINGRTPGGRFCLFWVNGTTLSTQYRDDSGLSRAAGGVWTRSQTATGAVSTTNQWYFIQITGNETTDEWRVGVNLDVSTSDFGSQHVDPDANQWLLGRRNSTSYDHSKIANLQIYDRILSQSEITQNYNAQSSRFI